jgi:hypothetical protein
LGDIYLYVGAYFFVINRDAFGQAKKPGIFYTGIPGGHDHQNIGLFGIYLRFFAKIRR